LLQLHRLFGAFIFKYLYLIQNSTFLRFSLFYLLLCNPDQSSQRVLQPSSKFSSSNLEIIPISIRVFYFYQDFNRTSHSIDLTFIWKASLACDIAKF